MSDIEAALARERAAGVGWAAVVLQEGERPLSVVAEAARPAGADRTDVEELSVSAEDVKSLIRKKIKGRELE